MTGQLDAELKELTADWPPVEEVRDQDLRLCAICLTYHPRELHNTHMQGHGYTTIDVTYTPEKAE